jgi:hypothetical protein
LSSTFSLARLLSFRRASPFLSTSIRTITSRVSSSEPGCCLLSVGYLSVVYLSVVCCLLSVCPLCHHRSPVQLPQGGGPICALPHKFLPALSAFLCCAMACFLAPLRCPRSGCKQLNLPITCSLLHPLQHSLRRGLNQKRLEKETNCIIAIRGKVRTRSPHTLSLLRNILFVILHDSLLPLT